MAQLSDWLELMLAEIARRREEAQLSAEEETRRLHESQTPADTGSAVQSMVRATGTLPTASGERRRRRG